MRILAWAALAIVASLTADSALAQAYDPNYPVCLHVYEIGGDHMDCRFTSLQQCAASASGRSAMCLRNPYYAQDDEVPAVARQRPR